MAGLIPGFVFTDKASLALPADVADRLEGNPRSGAIGDRLWHNLDQ